MEYLKGLTPTSQAEWKELERAWGDGRLMLELVRASERLDLLTRVLAAHTLKIMGIYTDRRSSSGRKSSSSCLEST